jgi:hypothetical protein
MNALTQAIMLNNEGAQQLTSGKALEALHLMQSAVIVLNDFSCRATAMTLASIAPLHHIAPVKIKSSFCKHPQECIETDGLLNMFNRPLVIPTALANVSLESCSLVVETLSTYVIFNFALSCHLYGKASGTDAPQQRAMELYDLFMTEVDTRVASTCAPSLVEWDST